MKRTLAAAAIPAILFTLFAVPAAAQAPAVTADIVDFDFNPQELTFDAGTEVTWTNEGARPHTVTDRGGTFDTNPIAPGARGTVTFSAPGRYYIFCRINPARMNGVVTVNADPDAAVTRVQATDPAREGDQLSFDPPSVSVATGSTISFANVGGKPHTLTADDGSFDTGVVTPGAENGRFAGNNATITLNKPGTFPFHCEVHPAAMKGTITVQGAEKQGAGAASDAPRTAGVEVEDFSFTPSEASIAPGGTVTWTNNGNATHTATFDDVDLDTGNIASGAEGELTAPDEPGSYSYRCNIHPARMRGVLVIVGQNTADPVREAAAVGGGETGGGGPAPAVSGLVLATGVLGAFFGGLGIASFLAGRRKPPPPPPPEPEPAEAAAAA
jgi:plastocyanin